MKPVYFPAEREIVVTLKLLLSSAAVFIGHLVEIDRNGLGFDYLVLQENLEKHIREGCEVSLKKNSDSHASLKAISCRIAQDEAAPDRSPFGVPIRRCHVQFSEPLPPAEIQPFIQSSR
jgi:hypothetical protein